MYRTFIEQALAGIETDAPPWAIEAIMRMNNGGVLDHLDRERFDNEARLAAEVWKLLDEDTRFFYAEQPA